ncbi:MAG: MerR family transcriptional regulator [Anaerolineae bacterium]|nr:MerR family transcriptional regulator [Anaerolineae bacterium]
MMSIGQVSEQTGLSIHTLRYYEQIGLVTPVTRRENGHRTYSQEDVEQINFVLCLKKGGMPITDIKRYIELMQQGDDTVADRLNILRAHEAVVEQQMQELGKHLSFIRWKIDYYCEYHRNQLEQASTET